MIVLLYHRIRPAVRKNRRRDVPAKLERVQEIAVGIEMQHVTLRVVVKGEGAVENTPVRSNHRGRGGVIKDAAGSRLVRPRINSEVCAHATTARGAVWRKLPALRYRDAAAIVKVASQRGGPLGSEIRVDRHQEPITRRKMRPADAVNRAVRRDRRSHVDARSLWAAVNGRRHSIAPRWPETLTIRNL